MTNVYRSLNHTISNIHGVPLVQGPQTWGGTPGFTGTGMKIGDIDTGIDYTHADFGGPGTVAAWNTAFSQSTSDPTLPTVCQTAQLTPCFGPNAPKVKGGIDLVGDAYDAGGTAAQQIPHPDPNPLDCNGHGTHTAGTAAGDGVLANGHTFNGPYNASTVSGNSWNVGPGVAPQASIYAIRVFGCSGSVNDAVLMQAMEWAVDNHMDAINMSLGAPFGSAQSPDAEAATNAAKDGVIVVSASGNNGAAPYITSSPGSGAGTLAVAASDPTQSFPGATRRPEHGWLGHGDRCQRLRVREPAHLQRQGHDGAEQPRLLRPASHRRSGRLRERRHHDVPGQHARRRRPRHLRACREGDLRPGSRCSGGPDGQQREQACRRSRARSSRTPTRHAGRRRDPVLRRLEGRRRRRSRPQTAARSRSRPPTSPTRATSRWRASRRRAPARATAR